MIPIRTHKSVQPQKHIHYWLGVPVVFFWKDARGTQHEGVGLTRDLSIRGAYIFATSPPPLEASIKLKALLPPGNANLPLRIYGQGQVVRVESARGKYRAGFAVAAEPFVLRRGEAYL